jgi:hypothetical protein
MLSHESQYEILMISRQAKLIPPRELRGAQQNPSGRDAIVNGRASHTWKPYLATSGGLNGKIAPHGDAVAPRSHQLFLFRVAKSSGKQGLPKQIRRACLAMHVHYSRSP